MNKAMVWKLSVGDIVFKHNCDLLATLGSLDDPEQVRDDILAKWWNIKSERDLLQTLGWLETDGHSAIYRQAKAGKSTEFQKFFIKEFQDVLQGVDLTAWDLGRYVSLVRWGHHAGYLNEDKLWKMLDRTCSRLQQTYTSWEHFAEHYILGRFFWNGKPEEQQMYFALEYLLDNEHSPWKMVPWNTDLSSGGDYNWKRNNLYYVDIYKEGADKLVTKQHYYRRMITEDPLNPFVYNSFAHFLEEKMMDPESAIKYYERAVKVDKNFLQGYRNILSLISGSQWRKDQTKQVFEMWIKNMPQSDEAYFKYADWLVYKLGEYNEGQKCYEKAIELNDNEYTYYVDYGYFLAEVRHDYDLAREKYLKALHINPEGEQALINLQALREGLEAVIQFSHSSRYAKFMGKTYDTPSNS